MSIKYTISTLRPVDRTLEELKEDLIIQLEDFKLEFPAFSYKIELKEDHLIVKSLNLKEYAN
jgi:hypothetical protein